MKWSIPPGRRVGLTLAGAVSFASAVPLAEAQHLSLRVPGDSVSVGLIVLDAASDRRTADAVVRGSQLALHDANLRSGTNGRAFRLVVRAQADRWDAGSNRIVELVFEQHVRAVLGSITGRSAHLAEQIVTKGGVAFATPWATDPSLSQINLPWFFSCVPDDEQQAEALVTEIFDGQHLATVVTAFERSYDAEIAESAFARTAKRAGHPVDRRIALDDVRMAAQSIAAAGPEAVLLYASERRATELLTQIIATENHRPGSMRFFAPLSLVDLELRGGLKTLRQWLHVVVPGHNLTPDGRRFEEAYIARFGEQPAAAAAYAYDCARVVVEAIGRAGLNRIRIRDEMAATDLPDALTGSLRFDARGRRIGPISVAPINSLRRVD